MEKYSHDKLGGEVRSISGYYTLIEERRLPLNGEEILCTVGIGVVDNSCCGVGGCRFINVHGHIVSWKELRTDAGIPVSEVEPVCDAGERATIKKLLEAAYPHSQIIFL